MTVTVKVERQRGAGCNKSFASQGTKVKFLVSSKLAEEHNFHFISISIQNGIKEPMGISGVHVHLGVLFYS